MVDKPDNSVSSKRAKDSARKAWQPNQDTSDFLLAEFERLQNVHSNISQNASRRFEFYLTITSAAMGALLIISQWESVVLSRSFFHLIAIGFFVYGIITFLNLSWARGAQHELIVALQRIQDFFIEKQPVIREYLYFRSYSEPIGKYKFWRILGRGLGIGGGSEKAVVTLLNSSLLSYLIDSLLVNYLEIQLSQLALQATLVSVFLFSGVVHAIIDSLIYRYYRL